MKLFEFFRLEDRVLFDGAAAADVAAAAEAVEAASDNAGSGDNADADSNPDNTSADQNTDSAQPVPDAADFSATADPSVDDGSATPAETEVLVNDSPETISTDRELVVINGTVPDKEAILAELKPNQDVLILEDGNGLDELNAYLDEHADVKYSAIHLVTHGRDGQLTVNGESITAENFNAEEWAQIGEHLTSDGDILLYGCNLAENDHGKLLVDKIADASCADAAASDDATGISGDWDLEYTHGMIETASIQVDNYNYDLPTTLTVTSNLDTVDDSDGVLTLREALAQANDGDEIVFTLGANNKITLTSTLTINADTFATQGITIDGANTNGDNVILDGGRVNNSGGTQILNIASGNTVTLSNLTFQNGYTSSEGGAIYNQGGTLTVTNSTFSGNSVDNNGGAIYNDSGTLTINNSIFTANSTENGYGGAIYNSGTLTVTNSIFTGNSNEYDWGGAICNDGGTLTVTNSTFTGNSASWGGAIFNSLGTTRLVNSLLAGNKASAGSDVWTRGDSRTFTHAAYCLIGEVFNQKDGGTPVTDLSAFDSATETTLGVTSAVFADAANGDYTLSTNANPAAVSGVKTGIDANGNICYGAAVTGNVTEYTTDLAGNERGIIPDVGNYYSIGAYQAQALDKETGSTVVDLTTDIVNPYDGKYSLREAVNYAEANAVITYSGENHAASLNSGITIDKNIAIGDGFMVSTTNADGKLFTVASGATLTLNNVTLGNGTIDGAGTLAIASGKTVASTDLAINTAGFVNSGTLNISGTLTAPNVSSFGNVTYNGAANQTVLAGTYGTLTLSGDGTIKTVSGDLTITTLTNSATLAISGALNGTSGGDFGNVTYNGADQTVTAGKYGVLNLTGSGTKTLAGATTANTFAVTGDISNVITLQGSGNTLTATTLTADYANITNVKFASATTLDSWNAAANTNTVTAENCTNLTVKLGGVTFAGSDIVYGQTLGSSTIKASYSLFGANTTMTVTTNDAALYHVAYENGAIVSQTATVAVSAAGYAFNAPTSVTFKVTPKALDVNWGNNSYTYNGTVQTVTPTVTTGVGTETLDLSVSFGDGVTFKNAGSYTATASSGNRDYTLIGTTKALTIAQKEITISGIVANNKVYDGTTNATLDYTNAVFDGIVTGETLSVSASGSFADADAGTDKTVNITGVTLGNGTGLVANYTVKSDSQTTATADITQKNLTISADQFTVASKVYDGTTSAGTNSHAFDAASGVVTGDTVRLRYYAATLDSKNVNDVTKATFDSFSLDNGNYTFTATSVDKVQSGLITQKALTVTANDQTITYGESANLTNYNVSGFVTGESENLGSMSVTGFSTSGHLTAGVHALDGSALASTSGNYSIAFTSANVTVARQGLTIGIQGDQIKVYDGTTAVETADQTWTYDALAGDVIGLSANWAYYSKHATDGKTVTMSEIVLNGADSGNYYLVSDFATSSSGKITRKEITVTVTDQADTTYGDAVTPAYTHTGLASGDRFTGSLSISGNKSASGNWIVGDHDITRGTLAIDDDNYGNNYAITFVGDSFTVAQKQLVANNGLTTTKSYDGTESAVFDASRAGLIAQDAVTLNAAFVYNSANVKDATTIDKTQWSISGDDAANYNLVEYSPVAGSITAKIVDANWSDSAPYYYNGEDHTSTVSAAYTDLAGQSQSLAVTFSGKDSAFKDAGEYTASVVSQDSNYAISDATKTKSYVMIALSTGNADTYTQGLNWNFDSTIPAINGNALAKGQATSPTEGNLYTAPYSTLVSATVINTPNAGARVEGIQPHFRNAGDWIFVHPRADGVEMTSDNISTTLSSTVAGIGKIVNAEGFASGDELHSHLPVEFLNIANKFDGQGQGEMQLLHRGNGDSVFNNIILGSNGFTENSDFIFQKPSFKMPRAFFLGDTPEENAAFPEYDDLAGLPEVNLPPQNDRFKTDFELLLDEMLVTAG